MTVLFDLQGIQSPEHGERGIGRYILELACAIRSWHPDAVRDFVLNPGLGVPSRLEPLIAGEGVEFSDRVPPGDCRIYHMASPFESQRLNRLWPLVARRLALVTTVYDLIPYVFRERYLANPVVARRNMLSLELVMRSDRVHCISESTARDVVEHLEIRPSRVVVVGAAPSERFRPPASKEQAREALETLFPSLPEGYILYVGGFEFRKNVPRLLDAYSRLDPDVRDRHQLVMAYELPASERERLAGELARLGIERNVTFTGWVPDNALVLLYQAAHLFVFPSIYEGFGLPVAEAMACGTPVIAANNSSLVELVQDEAALFDARDPASIAAAMERALTDTAVRARLEAVRLPERYTWRSVADRTVESYEELSDSLPRRRPRRLPRPHIAYLSPIPPSRSGIADYSWRLLTELLSYCDVDVFTDEASDTPEPPRGIEVYHTQRFDDVESTRGGYDRIVYCIGNNSLHVSAIELLRRRPGVVIAHDLRLVTLYAWCAMERPEFLPQGFHAAIQNAYGGRVPPDLGRDGGITWVDADRYGILLSKEIIALSEQFFTHSRYAANLARLDAEAEDEPKIGVLPFAVPDPHPPDGKAPGSAPLVASFGIVDPIKQSPKILDAFCLLARRRPEARFALVGHIDDKAPYLRRIEEMGVTGRVELTGHVTSTEYSEWLQQADLAVQLRESSNGESSATAGDCLAAGVPTIVTSLASGRELPDACTLKVSREILPTELAGVLEGLLDDSPRREAMRRAAIDYARSHRFAHLAEVFYHRILGGKSLAVLSSPNGGVPLAARPVLPGTGSTGI